jgi:uncharacterized protein (TIGR02284 family)
MIFADIAGEERAAFVERAPEDRIAADDRLRAAWSFFPQVFSIHFLIHAQNYGGALDPATVENFIGPGRERNAACDSSHMSQKKEIISTLNSLIETLKDGQKGFQQAASGVDDPQLKTTFESLSLQRSKFAGELQSEIVNLGEPEPEDSSSVAGSMHRAWINVKSAVTSRDPHAILAECERGEDSAVAEYKKAMEADLPAPIQQIVSRQSVEVKSAHDKIRSLRDATAQK